MRGTRRGVARAALTLAAALLAGSPGCAPEPAPNLLLVVVDTLRADHLGCYGYERPTSPAIDAFAAGAVRFERAYAAAPWTKPSVASMITGLNPAALGIDNIFSRLPGSADTLAEILAAEGYRTAGVVSHVMLSNQWNMGFGQGYEIYHESEARGHSHVSTRGVTDRAIALLGDLAGGDRPFLLFVHYFDPHFDYLDHAEIDFAAERSAQLTGGEDIIELRERVGDLTEDDFRFLRDRYDEEIRLTDDGVGRLLGALAGHELERETVVVFTSDHGEELGEKGWLGHTPTLYEMVIRVPLIVRAARSQSRPTVVGEPVSLVSLTPTMLELLGIDPAGRGFHGRSFAGKILGAGRTDDDRAGDGDARVYVEIDFPLQDPRISPVRLLKRAIVGPRFKLIADDVAGGVELYDLIEDPGEERDLAAARPQLLAKLLARLREEAATARVGGPRAEDVALSEEELEVLRSLGYVEPAPPQRR